MQAAAVLAGNIDGLQRIDRLYKIKNTYVADTSKVTIKDNNKNNA